MKIKKVNHAVQTSNFKIPQNALKEAIGEERATAIQQRQVHSRGVSNNVPQISYQSIAYDLLDLFAVKDSSGLNMAMEIALTVARKKPEAALAFLRDMIKEEKASKSQQGQVFAPVIIQTPDSPEDIIKGVLDAANRQGKLNEAPLIDLPKPDIYSPQNHNEEPLSPVNNLSISDVEELSVRGELLPFETVEEI